MIPQVRAAAARLAAAGVASPRHDAEELAAHLLGLSRAKLVLLDRLPAGAADRYAELVEQRAARVPLQHLTGVAGFRRLELAVGPGVFVPRPETEVLAGWAVGSLAGACEPLVVDLCAGSGAVALAVADEVPGARVHAVERDPYALAWAERNVNAYARASARGHHARASARGHHARASARGHHARASARGHLDLPVTLHRGDVADPALLAGLTGIVDVVTANPPYIPDGAAVEREVAEHDPPAALWGGPDGLDVVRMVERAAARLLRPGGRVGVEHADAQGESVPAVFAGPEWTDVADRPDLAGRPRLTTARRTG